MLKTRERNLRPVQFQGNATSLRGGGDCIYGSLKYMSPSAILVYFEADNSIPVMR